MYQADNGGLVGRAGHVVGVDCTTEGVSLQDGFAEVSGLGLRRTRATQGKAQMSRPQIAAFLVSLMMAACGLAGCASAPIDRSLELLGEPTPIKAGQSPMDVLCEIRAEFMALPKPVLRRIVYHGKSSRKRRVEFGTLSTKFLSAYY